MLAPLNAILGGALLVAGRKLFWLFIGVLGFITGVQLTTNFINGPEWLTIIIGLIVGFIFAMLAIFLQTIAIWVAGFLSGGYVLSALAGMLGMEGGRLAWVVYIIGGIIGIALVSFLFDWAVITLSSFAGASLVVEAMFSNQRSAQLIFIALFIIGIIIQGSFLRRDKGRVAAT